MIRQNTTIHRLIRRLQPSPGSFAAAAAAYDQGPLLQAQAAQRPPAS